MNSEKYLDIGVLSDTHLESPEEWFVNDCKHAFAGCDAIIHAGDLTNLSILNVFKPKDVYSVHGNSCDKWTRMSLPPSRELNLAGYSICVLHGTGPRYNIKERVFETFPWADCIIFGHSHEPFCERVGNTLLLNPGSFRGTGRWGSPGTFARLCLRPNGLQAEIHTLPPEP